MDNFFEGLAPEQAGEIERLSRLMYELRANREQVLGRWQASDPDQLLARIRQGDVAEHPAYEAWLSARILEDTRLATRRLLDQRLREFSTP